MSLSPLPRVEEGSLDLGLRGDVVPDDPAPSPAKVAFFPAADSEKLLGRAVGDKPVGVRIGAGEVGVNIPVPLSADSLGLELPLGKALRVAEAAVPSLAMRSIGAVEEIGDGRGELCRLAGAVLIAEG